MTLAPLRRIVIGISGPSGAGKTALSDGLIQRFPDASLLMQDWYFKPSEELEEDMNFCDPSTMLIDDFLRDMQSAAAGHPVEAPNMDMSTFERLPGTRHVAAGPALIVEGMTIFRFPLIYPLFQLRLYLQLPVDEIRRRKIDRDGQDRGRSLAGTLRQLKGWVIPEYERDAALLGEDVVFLDARRPAAELCEEAARLIQALTPARDNP